MLRLLPWALLGLAACAAAPRAPEPESPTLSEELRPYVERQLREMEIPGACLALLDAELATGGWKTLTMGFGAIAPGGGPMPPDAVHRVASISKLFTDAAAMRLVERGVLDLDRPVRDYLPEFAPRNPFGTEVTLRHLMGHRGGVVRESPVGHYFDPSEPGLMETVESLSRTSLVFEPGTTGKYSNPGVGVVGAVVARVTGKPFEQAVRELVLDPLGLEDSDFLARPDLLARQAQGVMWTYDGRSIPTPDFQFGYGPAANLRSTVDDLVGFASSWFPNAAVPLLRRETLEEMWRLPGDGWPCGLGFFVSDLDGHRLVSHGGAVYGFASVLMALPDEGLAVSVVCTKDFANSIANAIARRALRLALARREGRALPPVEFPEPVGAREARRFAGHWRCGDDRFDLYERGGELVYDPATGVRTRMRRRADGVFVADSVMQVGGGKTLEPLKDGGLLRDGVACVRDDATPGPCPDMLRPYLGEYGSDHDVLIVYEDRGQLGVLIEWLVRDLLEPVGEDLFRFPGRMYRGDELRFERDADGKVVAAFVGGARFARRPGPTAGIFRIDPVRPVRELVAEAAKASPPPRPEGLRAFDLVDLAAVRPSIRFDIRYATERNFLGVPVYARARARLQRPAAEALGRVADRLAEQGLGLLVFDAYRPWSVTKVFYDATPEGMKQFVADPKDGSRHNRGCAVDLGLYDLASGEVLPMPSGYDEFTASAYADYVGTTARRRHDREVLRRAMEAEGFAVYEFEWWHFDYGDWRRYPIGNEPL